MDRFEWCDGNLYTGEQLVEQQTGVALYDGTEKVITDMKSDRWLTPTAFLLLPDKDWSQVLQCVSTT